MAAITTAAIGAGTAIYAAKKSSDNAKAQQKLGKQAIDAADPFKQYRPEYAKKLNELMADPSSIKDTPEYKARLDAAARQLAAQGYTGSGNAVIEAANAGGQAYQQAYSNLVQLSGAGVTPGGGYDVASNAMSEGNAQKMSALAGVGNNLTNLAATIGGNKGTAIGNTGGAGFNKLATPVGSNSKGGGG